MPLNLGGGISNVLNSLTGGLSTIVSSVTSAANTPAGGAALEHFLGIDIPNTPAGVPPANVQQPVYNDVKKVLDPEGEQMDFVSLLKKYWYVPTAVLVLWYVSKMKKSTI